MGLLYKILIVEDDFTIAKALRQQLSQWGYDAAYVEDFQSVITEFRTYEPHLVLLDIGLPFFNGYHWCAKIREISKVPIVFLSSASDNMNIVLAMNMGGDDFIPKPFDFNVAVAKVQALLRRTYSFISQVSVLEHQGLLLNLGDATAVYGGKKQELTKNEFKILQCLIENKGKVVARETIMTRLWESDSFIDDNTLTVNVNRLRKKLESIGALDFVHTKKGLGYYVEG